MQELSSWIAEIGLSVVGDLQLDGKVYRCDREGKRSKSAWYVGWSQPFTIVVAGDWRTGDKWEYKGHEKAKLSRDDKAAIKAKVQAAARAAEQERLRAQIAAAQTASHAITAALPATDHPYLTAKQVGAFGVYTLDISLIIPVREVSTGDLVGYQRILPDGKKLFAAGQRVSGCAHRIPGTQDRVFVCEGYATGATLHMASGSEVWCAFNAGNLGQVAKAVRLLYPDAAIAVAGDDDLWTKDNPGRTKAAEAAVRALGAAIFPKFQTTDGKPTDFNDLLIREGLDVVKAQLGADAGLEKIFVPLGFDGQTYYVYSYRLRNLLQFNSFAKTQFYGLAPRDHWEKTYPRPHAKDDPIDWEQAKDDLITACQRVGPFDSTRIRGSGVWLDRGRVVLNTAKELIVNGCPQPITRFSTHHVYVSTKNQLPKPHDRPLTVEECAPLVAACERFKWKHPKFAPYLAGWLAIARVAGALPVRPHVWLTGGSGTGKSTAMDRLIRPALGDVGACLYAQGGTTEAGLRQMVKADSIPVIFDEFETTGDTSRGRVDAIIELLRQSWSFTGGAIVKGGADGTAATYQLAFAALVSSIRVALANDADRSRFTVLELAPHDSSKSHWHDLKAVLNLITAEYGERLFARSVSKISVIQANFKVFSDVLSGRMGQRFAAQHGMLLAGYGILTSDKPIDQSDAEAFVSGFNLEDDRAAETSDQQDCFDTVLTRRLRIAENYGLDGIKDVDKTIGEIIRERHDGQLKVLRSYGIYVSNDHIDIAKNHDTLKRYVFADTRWSGDWHKSLMRLEGAVETTARAVAKTYAGRTTSVFARLPISLLAD